MTSLPITHPDALYEEIEALRQQLADSQKGVVMLRAAVVECLASGESKGAGPHGISVKAINMCHKALAATEPKDIPK